MIRGLKNIAIDASFETSLKGPVTALVTDVRLSGTGGGVHGRLTLDTSVPGWHGAGAVAVDRLNLARWLNRDDRPSDITGHVTFDLALELGAFPRGMYTFKGRTRFTWTTKRTTCARGQLTATQSSSPKPMPRPWRGGRRAPRASGSMRRFDRFQDGLPGSICGACPAVPVPRVESLLTFDMT